MLLGAFIVLFVHANVFYWYTGIDAVETKEFYDWFPILVLFGATIGGVVWAACFRKR